MWALSEKWAGIPRNSTGATPGDSSVSASGGLDPEPPPGYPASLHGAHPRPGPPSSDQTPPPRAPSLSFSSPSSRGPSAETAPRGDGYLVGGLGSGIRDPRGWASGIRKILGSRPLESEGPRGTWALGMGGGPRDTGPQSQGTRPPHAQQAPLTEQAAYGGHGLEEGLCKADS